MERKIKHRILGGLVLIGLVIILLPLFQDNNEVNLQTTSVKAPPFPDQAIDVNSEVELAENNKIRLQTDDLIASSTNASSLKAVATNEVIETAKNENEVNDLSAAEEDSVVPKASALELVTGKAKETAVIPIKSPFDQPEPAAETVAPKPKVAAKKEIKPIKMAKVNLAKPSWVIQLGSFKSKSNALRLVNELRANGYHAFLQQNPQNAMEQTKVFVGPENKKTDAKLLASQLEVNLHLRGVVVSYKPLTM